MKLPKAGDEGEFVIHEHKATRLHWDLRLEVPSTPDDFENMDVESYKRLGVDVKPRDTVMMSFAIPKATFPQKGVRLLAVETEPHPVEYNSFEGKIPEGMYGAGDVKIWDKGKVRWIEVSPHKLVFELEGRRIRGKFALLKFRGEEKKWLWLRVGRDS